MQDTESGSANLRAVSTLDEVLLLLSVNCSEISVDIEMTAAEAVEHRVTVKPQQHQTNS